MTARDASARLAKICFVALQVGTERQVPSRAADANLSMTGRPSNVGEQRTRAEVGYERGLPRTGSPVRRHRAVARIRSKLAAA